MRIKLDVEARLDIHDLLARYCHLVDSGDAEGWSALFAEDGVFDVPGAIHLVGRAQLRSMPGIVLQQGERKWRHQITNIVVEAGDTPDTAHVRAYGVLSDWRKGGVLAAFSDYRIELRRVQGAWQVVGLTATQIGSPS
jgi:3-phenylpropionate/cinnamic acid dioxygenase small subunit